MESKSERYLVIRWLFRRRQEVSLELRLLASSVGSFVLQAHGEDGLSKMSSKQLVNISADKMTYSRKVAVPMGSPQDYKTRGHST